MLTPHLPMSFPSVLECWYIATFHNCRILQWLDCLQKTLPDFFVAGFLPFAAWKRTLWKHFRHLAPCRYIFSSIVARIVQHKKWRFNVNKKLPLADHCCLAHWYLSARFRENWARKDDDPLSRYDSYVWMSGQRNERWKIISWAVDDERWYVQQLLAVIF